MTASSASTSALQKPPEGAPCNGCGYCCASEPCQLAKDFLKCSTGPCVALELSGGVSRCGFVRNPLGYLFRVAHPSVDMECLESMPPSAAGEELSAELASALGVGRGCDSADCAESALWVGPAGARIGNGKAPGEGA